MLRRYVGMSKFNSSKNEQPKLVLVHLANIIQLRFNFPSCLSEVRWCQLASLRDRKPGSPGSAVYAQDAVTRLVNELVDTLPVRSESKLGSYNANWRSEIHFTV